MTTTAPEPAPATRSEAKADFSVRAAELRDVAPMVQMIRELAEFEQLEHLVQVTPEKLRPHLFGEKPVAEAMVAEVDGKAIAFALYFTNFSTFLAQPGLYLEDLYVQPAWSVLDWNANAIRFYERMGATVMPDWRICRISGAALQAFAP